VVYDDALYKSTFTYFYLLHFIGIEPVKAVMKSATHGRYDARPTVAFPTADRDRSLN